MHFSNYGIAQYSWFQGQMIKSELLLSCVITNCKIYKITTPVPFCFTFQILWLHATNSVATCYTLTHDELPYHWHWLAQWAAVILFFFHSPSLSLPSLSHTHMHVRTHTHHARVHTHHTHMRARTHTDIHIHQHTHTGTDQHTYTHT